MNVTITEFLTRLRGAITYDDLNYPRLKISEWLLSHWAFDDSGAWFFHAGQEPKQPKWPPDVKSWPPAWRELEGFTEQGLEKQ